MIERELPFNRQTAFKLMKVAEHPTLSDVSHGKHLPPAWTTLYELTKVPVGVLESAIKDGRVHPGMERKDTQAILPKPGNEKRQVEAAGTAK
jgi:hypothetical protein